MDTLPFPKSQLVRDAQPEEERERVSESESERTVQLARSFSKKLKNVLPAFGLRSLNQNGKCYI